MSSRKQRLLGWGDLMRQEFLTQPRDAGVVRDLEAIDFNQVRSGTLDSISEELLTEFRPARVGAPIVLDEFVARALVLREGLFAHGRHNSAPVRDFLARLAGTKFGINTATISGAVHELSDHFVHDFIDVAAYTAASTDPG